MEKRPTIQDVADMAGVAKSTVSRYLNGKPVQEESGRRIRQAIEHYNYEANVFARLSAKQSHIIGIILPGLDSTVTPRMLTAMDKYLRAKDYTPLIINTAGDLDFEVRSIGDLARMRVDGIILVASYITPAHCKAVERCSCRWSLPGRSSVAGSRCWMTTLPPARNWAAMWRRGGCAAPDFCG